MAARDGDGGLQQFRVARLHATLEQRSDGIAWPTVERVAQRRFHERRQVLLAALDDGANLRVGVAGGGHQLGHGLRDAETLADAVHGPYQHLGRGLTCRQTRPDRDRDDGGRE
jgi:hypothetical protein